MFAADLNHYIASIVLIVCWVQTKCLFYLFSVANNKFTNSPLPLEIVLNEPVFVFRPNKTKHVTFRSFCARNNFPVVCFERESFFQRWFLAPYRDHCLCVELVRLDNECKSPPLEPASTHHLPTRDKVRCSPNYENSLGESCCRVSALSPCPSHTSPHMIDSST